MKNLLDRLGQSAWMTSTFGGKYVAAIATASSFGAVAAAKQLAAALRDSVFRRAYVSGTLGVHLRGQHGPALQQALPKARALGGMGSTKSSSAPASSFARKRDRQGAKWMSRQLPHLH